MSYYVRSHYASEITRASGLPCLLTGFRALRMAHPIVKSGEHLKPIRIPIAASTAITRPKTKGGGGGPQNPPPGWRRSTELRRSRECRKTGCPFEGQPALRNDLVGASLISEPIPDANAPAGCCVEPPAGTCRHCQPFLTSTNFFAVRCRGGEHTDTHPARFSVSSLRTDAIGPRR